MRILGSLFIDMQELQMYLPQIFPLDEIKHRVRVIGEEIKINGEIHELHIETHFQQEEDSLIIEGEILLKTEQAISRLKAICQSFGEKGIQYDIDYYPDSDDDTEERNIQNVN